MVTAQALFFTFFDRAHCAKLIFVAILFAPALFASKQFSEKATPASASKVKPVEVSEKPDILWDKPQLERLYARLEDEYELKERAESLNRKLAVIAETAQVLTDIIDTRRSLRLELIIVFLILFEVLITMYELATRHG